MGRVRSLLFLAGLTFRRQLFSWKTLLCVAFLALIAGLVLLAGVARPWRPSAFGRFILVHLYGGFFVPVVALAYGTAALGDARDERSLVHVLARAIPRTGAYAAMLIGVLPLGLALTLGGLRALAWVARIGMEEPPDVFGLFWLGVLLSTAAYLSLFHLFAALFRHATVIAIAYVFFIEVFIGRVPGIMKRVSINFFATSVYHGKAGSLGLFEGGRGMRLYLPIDGTLAAWILAGIAAGLLAIGAWVFAGREYRDLT